MPAPGQKTFPKVRNRYLLICDAVLIAAAPAISYALRFEGWSWSGDHRATAVRFTAFVVPIYLIVFFAFGLYRRLWRYASIAELELIFSAAATADVLAFLVGGW